MDKRFTKVTLLSIFRCKYIPQGTPGPVAGPKGEVCGPNLRNLAGNSWSFFLAQTSSLLPQETQGVPKEAQWSCLRRRLDSSYNEAHAFATITTSMLCALYYKTQ